MHPKWQGQPRFKDGVRAACWSNHRWINCLAVSWRHEGTLEWPTQCVAWPMPFLTENIICLGDPLAGTPIFIWSMNWKNVYFQTRCSCNLPWNIIEFVSSTLIELFFKLFLNKSRLCNLRNKKMLWLFFFTCHSLCRLMSSGTTSISWRQYCCN